MLRALPSLPLFPLCCDRGRDVRPQLLNRGGQLRQLLESEPFDVCACGPAVSSSSPGRRWGEVGREGGGEAHGESPAFPGRRVWSQSTGLGGQTLVGVLS